MTGRDWAEALYLAWQRWQDNPTEGRRRLFAAISEASAYARHGFPPPLPEEHGYGHGV